MNVTIGQPISIKGLKAYKEKNPVKFKHKYGDLDLNAVDEGFPFALYKKLVVEERVKREKNNIPQDKLLTPETVGLVKKEIPVEPAEAPKQEVPTESSQVGGEGSVNTTQ